MLLCCLGQDVDDGPPGIPFDVRARDPRHPHPPLSCREQGENPVPAADLRAHLIQDDDRGSMCQVEKGTSLEKEIKCMDVVLG